MVERPSVIGISGLIGSGKDEVARVLIEEFGYTRIGFADALKREVRTILPRTLAVLANLNYDGEPLSLEARIDKAIQNKPLGVRELLQEWGTELRRAEDPDYWVKRWLEQVYGVQKVVAPDCRFPNEIEAVRRLGGQHWQVVRPGQASQDHASEQSLDGTTSDLVIINDLSLTALRAAVRTIMQP